MFYFVSFDIPEEYKDKYDKIYEWVHSKMGGFHFIEMTNGGEGRLPSTCVVVQLESTKPVDAANEFARKMYDSCDAVATHVSVVEGVPSGISDPIKNLPRYVEKANLNSSGYEFVKRTEYTSKSGNT